MAFRNEQEAFWAGDFGTEYIDRNKSNSILTSNIELFSKIFARTYDVKSVIEFGANIGMNLKALKTLFPFLNLAAVEINGNAIDELKKDTSIEVFHQSIAEFAPTKKYDVVLVKGVLIHLNPDDLNKTYELLYKASDKYILIVEYYNPTPTAVLYRGHSNKLFKRDFAGEIIDKFADLRLIDYGFSYHRDNYFPGDDTTWFLLGKKGNC